MLTNLWAWIRGFKRQSADTVLAGDRVLVEPETTTVRDTEPVKAGVRRDYGFPPQGYRLRKRRRKAQREARHHNST